MSLVRYAMKLRIVNPVLQQIRSGHWGGCNHVIVGPPSFRFPFWKKMMLQGTFVVFMFSYPLYVVWMMYEWDLIEREKE